MAKYVFPAIVRPDGTQYSVEFPDLNNARTCGETLEEALEMADDLLPLILYDREEDNAAIPAPTPYGDIKEKKGEMVTLVKADTTEYRKKVSNKVIKKTVTMPSWLNAQAEAAGINFSQELQAALKEKLGVG